MKLNEEQLKVLEKIEECGTHTFYTVDYTHEIERAFGFREGELVEIETANTRNPKGLSVSGAGRNAKVRGSSSHNVVEAIARKLGVTYRQAYGRGSEQRNALDAIRAATR